MIARKQGLTIAAIVAPFVLAGGIAWMDIHIGLASAQDKVAENARRMERVWPRLNGLEGQSARQQQRLSDFIEEQRAVNLRTYRQLDKIDGKLDRILEQR